MKPHLFSNQISVISVEHNKPLRLAFQLFQLDIRRNWSIELLGNFPKVIHQVSGLYNNSNPEGLTPESSFLITTSAASCDH